jgi:hypothetical protein
MRGKKGSVDAMIRICCLLLACLILTGCCGIEVLYLEGVKSLYKSLIHESQIFTPKRLEGSEVEIKEEGIKNTTNHWNEVVLYSRAWNIPNPIDGFFKKVFEIPMCEAERNDFWECYGNAWKNEFENLVSWTRSQMVYQEDIDNMNAFAQHVVSTPTLALELLMVVDFTVSPDDPTIVRTGGHAVGVTGSTNAIIYSTAFYQIYGLLRDYEFLDQEYIPEKYLLPEMICGN